MFCGPVMDIAGSWSANVPGGILGVTMLTIAIGVVLFTYLEDTLSEVDAAYMSFITGTTIGYALSLRQSYRCILSC